MTRYFFLFGLLFSFNLCVGQLGFCEGSKGDPIFQEDFGSGTGYGPALDPEITSYTYVTQDPQDGQYTISNQLGQQILSWHSYLPTYTLSNGRALIVNADYTSGQFFKTSISGLCENTSYEFSAYLINIYDPTSTACLNREIPINVRFEIWDETDTQLLKEGSTGVISSSASPKWEQYALTFKSESGQDKVILKMFNNGEGGCGNDLAIDDIIFRSCGDLTTISSPETNDTEFVVCEEETPVATILTATPDFSVYNTHVFQWQESVNSEIWSDIPGETGSIYNTPQLTSSKYYRVKVAEDQVNLNNNLCSSASEAFYIHVIKTPDPPLSLGDVSSCSNEPIPVLSVEIGEGETASWYDKPAGGNLLRGGSTTFQPDISGVYYVEAANLLYNCPASTRTAIEFTINESPQVEDEYLQLCPNSSLMLNAEVSGFNYQWSTGETSQSITINEAGDYRVTITSNQGCSAIKKFTISPIDDAEIESIASEGDSVIINPANSGTFEYSIDGINYQLSSVFNEVPSGVYTGYMRDMSGCKTVYKEFPHIVASKFITPNGDGYNDVFRLNGVSYFPASEIRVFDRYGKLLKSGSGEGFFWDGTLKGKNLPGGDYWYHILIEEYGVLKGHFSLKR
ncbi:T9SS type B sorting domain-containing protein [Gillisia sp. M10.2A]|uniref:T9SS type B sorting domain-containing protein n=1 Tax=Gillisia lutea TaxID=2909668 RepID=A0ABS9EC40_9FLAO|nr:T9SS type B sorting domain-containing protein [Gillisia lutea]MCF4100451.1 T9SS type B sorting domain-containing protein [Gillisia lutea]